MKTSKLFFGFFLELIRILVIFILIGMLLWLLVNSFYDIWNLSDQNKWIGTLGIALLIFILYRNKYQFNGWYKGKGKEKLSPFITKFLLVLSAVLILIPLLIAAFK